MYRGNSESKTKPLGPRHIQIACLPVIWQTNSMAECGTGASSREALVVLRACINAVTSCMWKIPSPHFPTHPSEVHLKAVGGCCTHSGSLDS